MSSAEELDPDLPVHFFPPLHLQRRVWVLNVMRREAVTSVCRLRPFVVLDIGCGEGELLQALCQPAPWLEPPPGSSPTDVALHKNEILNLHPMHVSGLDVCAPDLQFTVANAAPVKDVRRWEPLEANVWEGGLEAFNPHFVDVECIVATEVIEHLPTETLSFFAPILLGVYHPRLLLITSPSYTFNARFTAPDSDKRNGFPDPTGRTDRVFRHHDHHFEWTVEEFQDYCDKAATEWAYEVTYSTIGYAMEKDKWERDEQLGGATQVAEFKRRSGEAFAKARAEKSQDWLEKAKAMPEHRLLATHHHTAHPKARQPVSLREIGDAVRSLMVSYREVFMRMEDVWFTDVSVLCGGWIELLTQAIEEHEQLKLHKEDEQKRRTWRVELIGGAQGPTLEELDREAEIGQHYFPEVSGEWETEAQSVSSKKSVYDAEADDEGSSFNWDHAEDSNKWGDSRARSEDEMQPETIEEVDEPPEEHDTSQEMS